MIQTTNEYSEELFNLLVQYDSVFEAGIVHQVNVIFDYMKRFSRSRIPSVHAATSDYEKMEEKGKEVYDSAKALLNYLKQTKIS